MYDIITLIGEFLTESVVTIFMGAVIVCAVIVGKKLRDSHDTKAQLAAAGQPAVDEARANDSDDK